MENTGKLICYAIGCIILFHIIAAILPHLLTVLALCGAWYLYQEYKRNKRRY